MSAQELADLESLHNDGVLDDDEYQTKLAELKPRSQAEELADLKALLDEGILDADEYVEKRKEIEGPPPKKARTQKPPPAADDYEKLTVAKLKAKSKERGLAMSGEKGVLIWRLKLKDAHGDLTTKDGADPFSFRGAALKKAAARHGIICMGSPEEMLEGIVTKLAKDAPSKPALDEDGSQDARRAATRILELVAEDAWDEILSLGAPGKTLTSRSPLNDLRGAYRRLSRLVHPDKLRGFDGATRAFQALVTALDRVTNPEAPAVEGEAARGPAIERTNEGCRRTRVACPRCEEPWGVSKNEGLPDYAYNLLMTGLREYTCSTCLCEFGCVSATHACKKCAAPFDYSPQDFHREIKCGECGDEFGFWSYHVSARNMATAVAEARTAHERRAKSRLAKRRRADAAQRRGGDLFDGERAFLNRLADHCPKCGDFFGVGTSMDDRRTHLRACTDAAAHGAHAESRADATARQRQRDDLDDAAATAQARAVWEASGAQTSTLWMLPDAALVEMIGGDTDGLERDELIARAVASRDGGRNLLTNGSPRKAARRRLTAASLPANYATLAAAQLRGICAAHGFTPKGTTQAEIVHEIENELTGDAVEQPLLLTDGDGDGGRRPDADYESDGGESD